MQTHETTGQAASPPPRARKDQPVQAIPEELRHQRRWVCWDRTPRDDGRPSKTPINPRTGENASVSDPATWASFDEAVACAKANVRMGGVGFVLTDSDCWSLDLDHVISDDGEVSPSVLRFIDSLTPTYIERSPSGHGLHIVFRGERPAQLSRTRVQDAFGPGMNLEIFGGGSARYITVTGNVWNLDATSSHHLAEAAAADVDAILALFPAEPRAEPKPAGGIAPLPIGDEMAKATFALRNVPSDDYHEWIHVGMALHSAFGEAGKVLWIEWSRKSAKFEEAAIDKHWRSFHDGNGGKSIAYIYWLAGLRNPGWRDEWTCANSSTIHRAPEADGPAPTKLTRQQLRLRLRQRSEILCLPPTRWLIKNYATCGSVLLLGADPNLGKSTLANAWAHCIWTGTPWLGHSVRAGSVLFVLGEDARGAALRARAWEAAYGSIDQVADRYIEYADRMPALCEPAGQLELRRLLVFLVQEHGHAPALVVIDTLSTVWGSEPENAAELAAALMSVLSSLADEFGCTFLLVHHLNKAQPGPIKREITLSSIRGASAFVGSADDVLVLEAIDGGARLFGIKARNTDKAPEKLLGVHRVSLGTNEDGDEIASVILIEASAHAVLSPEDAERANRDKAWIDAEQRVQHAVETLRKMGNARSRTAIANRMTGKRAQRFSAIDDAMSRELIVDLGTDRKHHFVVADDPQCVSHNTPHTPEPGTGNRSFADAGPDSVPSESGTGSQTAGTGNRSAVPLGMDDGMPEKPKRRRKAKPGGGA